MDIQAKIEARKARWREFIRGEGPRFMFMVRVAVPGDPEAKVTRLWPGHESEHVEWAWSVYQRQMERAAWLDDDSLPHLNCLTGTEIFAEAFGCEVHRPDHTNPFALHKVETAAEADALAIPRLESSSLMRFFGIAEELRRRAGPEALVRMIDVQSPMDVAALIWEKTSFMMAMFDTPEAVKNISAKVRTLMAAFFDEWFRRFGPEHVAHYPDYLMSKGVTLSEDEVGAVNPEMFEQFFLDELTWLSNRYGGLGMHCCADSRHQWPSFKKIPGLRLLNLCTPPTKNGAEFVGDALKLFAGQCAQMHYGWTPSGPVETWPSQLPENARFVFDIPAKTKEEAVEICGKLSKVRG